jgi:hypothetical protein
MKSILITVAAGLVVAASPGYAGGTKIQSTESGKPHMEFAPCPAKGRLRLFVRSGEIRIVGSDEAKLSIDLTGRKSGQIQDVKARLTCSENSAELHVTGGPHNDLTITIHVPQNLDLYTRVPAGEVSVEGITGNKDVELHAGELTIDVVNAKDYGHIDASVYAGEVDAEAFGDNKGGLFRSISKTAEGPYYLHAHVGSGQLILR